MTRWLTEHFASYAVRLHNELPGPPAESERPAQPAAETPPAAEPPVRRTGNGGRWNR
jgi:hypothetical protein